MTIGSVAPGTILSLSLTGLFLYLSIDDMGAGASALCPCARREIEPSKTQPATEGKATPLSKNRRRKENGRAPRIGDIPRQSGIEKSLSDGGEGGERRSDVLERDHARVAPSSPPASNPLEPTFRAARFNHRTLPPLPPPAKRHHRDDASGRHFQRDPSRGENDDEYDDDETARAKKQQIVKYTLNNIADLGEIRKREQNTTPFTHFDDAHSQTGLGPDDDEESCAISPARLSADLSTVPKLGDRKLSWGTLTDSGRCSVEQSDNVQNFGPARSSQPVSAWSTGLQIASLYQNAGGQDGLLQVPDITSPTANNKYMYYDQLNQSEQEFTLSPRRNNFSMGNCSGKKQPSPSLDHHPYNLKAVSHDRKEMSPQTDFSAINGDLPSSHKVLLDSKPLTVMGDNCFVSNSLNQCESPNVRHVPDTSKTELQHPLVITTTTQSYSDKIENTSTQDKPLMLKNDFPDQAETSSVFVLPDQNTNSIITVKPCPQVPLINQPSPDKKPSPNSMNSDDMGIKFSWTGPKLNIVSNEPAVISVATDSPDEQSLATTEGKLHVRHAPKITYSLSEDLPDVSDSEHRGFLSELPSPSGGSPTCGSPSLGTPREASPPSSSVSPEFRRRRSSGERRTSIGGPRLRRQPTKESSIISISDNEGYTQLNQYRLENEVGKGSCGIVRLAYNVDDDNHYAMKILSKSKLSKLAKFFKRAPSRDGRAGTFKPKTSLDRVYREIAILKKLDHPNVVKLVEVLDDPNNDDLYLVFEYLERGEILEIPTSDPLNEETVWPHFRDIVLGIEYLHHQKIIHRDVKPSNLLVDDNGRIKISDFGVSDEFTGSDALFTDSAGTPAFTAPEMLEGNQNKCEGTGLDIWSMGVTLYSLVIGVCPFQDENVFATYNKIKQQPLVFPETITLSDSLKDLIIKMLTKNPESRVTLPEIREHPWVTKYGEEPLPPTEENVIGFVTVTAEEVQACVKHVPKLETLILVKSMLQKRRFCNPFSKRQKSVDDNLREEFKKTGRSNSAPGHSRGMRRQRTIRDQGQDPPAPPFPPNSPPSPGLSDLQIRSQPQQPHHYIPFRSGRANKLSPLPQRRGPLTKFVVLGGDDGDGTKAASSSKAFPANFPSAIPANFTLAPVGIPSRGIVAAGTRFRNVSDTRYADETFSPDGRVSPCDLVVSDLSDVNVTD